MKVGVWTPWAQVLCSRCHNALPDERRRSFDEVVVADEDADVDAQAMAKASMLATRCAECGEQIAMREDVAAEHNLVLLINEATGVDAARMEQTGGMCSACKVHLFGWKDQHPTELFITLDEECDPAQRPVFYVSMWAEDANGTLGDDPCAIALHEAATMADVLQLTIALLSLLPQRTN